MKLSFRRWAFALGPWAFLLLQSCHRAPQNATDLLDRLPRHWEGEVQMQGEGGGRKITIEVRQLTVRSEHVLEFNRVRYQLLAGGEALSADEAAVRGTITAPGGEIRLEEEGTDANEGLKPGSFVGKLDGKLQSVDATWTTGLGPAATLKLHAAAP